MAAARSAASEVRDRVLAAAMVCLLEGGFAGLSTRRIAEEARVPLSQIHYHFGSKRGLVLALLEEEDRRRLARQTRMYGEDAPLWKRYEQACDFLEEDLSSGYVRLLQEMIAAGWSDEDIAADVRRLLGGWYALLTEVADAAAERTGGLGPFTAAEVATLVGHAFIGAESMLLVGFSEDEIPTRAALRSIGSVIRSLEDDTR